MVTKKQITHAILIVLKEWERKGYSPFRINCGDCEIFAQEVFEYLKQKETNDFYIDSPPYYAQEICHYWINYKNKWFFDSECPDGVNDWIKLPLCKTILNDPDLPLCKKRVEKYRQEQKNQ